MKSRRLLSIIAALFIIALAAVVYIAFSRPAPPATNTTDNTQATNGTNDETSGTEQEDLTRIPVEVFFSKHPESDDDPSKTFPVDRTAPNRAVATYVIEQLLAGPSNEETDRGYFSTVRVRDGDSNCNGKDFTLSIVDGTATLRFCRTFDARGTVADGQAKQAITDSLKQFATVQEVIILTRDNHCQFDMSGEDMCLQ